MKFRSAPASGISARKGNRENHASVRINAVRTAVLDSGDYVGPSILDSSSAVERSPVKRVVGGSNPPSPATIEDACSKNAATMDSRTSPLKGAVGTDAKNAGPRRFLGGAERSSGRASNTSAGNASVAGTTSQSGLSISITERTSRFASGMATAGAGKTRNESSISAIYSVPTATGSCITRSTINEDVAGSKPACPAIPLHHRACD